MGGWVGWVGWGGVGEGGWRGVRIGIYEDGVGEEYALEAIMMTILIVTRVTLCLGL